MNPYCVSRSTRHRHGLAGHWGALPQAVCRTVVCLIALLALFTTPFLEGATGQTPPKVGVTSFYAPTPLAEYFGLIPERFAAADLTDSLSRTAGGKFTVIPHAMMEEAQAGIQWHGVDVLHYDRLGALAHAVGADWLVTGWIRELVINPTADTNSGVPFFGGSGQEVGYATVVVQTFSVSEGRIVGEITKYDSTASAELRSDMAMRLLHDTLQLTVPWAINAVTEQAP